MTASVNPAATTPTIARTGETLRFGGALLRGGIATLWPQVPTALDGVQRIDLTAVERIDSALKNAEELLEGCLDWTGRVLKQICCPDFHRCARSDVCKLAFYHGFKGVVVGKDSCCFQFYAILHNRFIDAPKIRRILLAVVCEVQCQNDRVISVRIFHDARALVEQLIVTELDQIGVFRLIFAAGGKAAEQHQRCKKQA